MDTPAPPRSDASALESAAPAGVGNGLPSDEPSETGMPHAPPPSGVGPQGQAWRESGEEPHIRSQPAEGGSVSQHPPPLSPAFKGFQVATVRSAHARSIEDMRKASQGELVIGSMDTESRQLPDKYRKHPLFLFFLDKRFETDFEQKRNKTRRQMVSLVVFHVVTFVLVLYHRLLQVAFDAPKLVACLALSVILGPGTVVLRCLPLTKKVFNRHYWLAVIINIVPVHICLAIVNVMDELDAEPSERCPARVSNCPHHAADGIAQVWVMVTTFLFNLICPVLFKYKVFINLTMLAIHTASTFYFPFDTEIYGCAMILFAVQAGTLSLAFVFESQMRSSMAQDMELQDDKLRIASILSTVLPPRLTLTQFTIPLIEKYDDVPVLFCSFDKEAVLNSVGPQAFFDTLEAIYSLFDDVVSCAGMWKVEHVGEDYVVSSPRVATQDPKDNTPEARHKHAVAIANVALALVREGNSFAQSTQGGSRVPGSARRNTVSDIDFKFKAGIHNGPIIGGVAGRTRRFYRLFGETVVMAARMCHHCKTGRVQVSGAFSMLLGSGSGGPTLERGRMISVKGKQSKIFVHYLSGDVTRPLVLQRTNASSNPVGSSERDEGAYKQLSIQLSRLGTSNVLDRVLKKRTNSVHLGIPGKKVAPAPQNTSTESTAQRGADWAMDSIDLMDPLINTMFRGGDDDESSQTKTRADASRADANALISNTHSTINKMTGKFVETELEDFYREDSVLRHRRRTMLMLKISLLMFIWVVFATHCMGNFDGWDVAFEEQYIGHGEGNFVRRWYSIASLFPAGILLTVILVMASTRHLTRSELDILSKIAVVSWLIMVSLAQIATNSNFKLMLQFALNSIIVISGVSPFFGLVCSLLATIFDVVVNLITLGDNDLKFHHTMIIAVTLQASNVVVFYAKVWMHAAERKLWVLMGDKVVEQKRKETLLTDLLPPYYAKRLLQGQGKDQALMSQHQMACVLFSDLSGFTALNDKLGANVIVQVMHGLWCCFDALVQKHDLYKMDTVGDAYVVIALCNSIDGLKEACQQMVILAQEMIVTLEDFSTTLEETITMRIGIDCGDVIAGVMGRIQPRFHAHGAVVANAQRLEGLCIKGSVLVSPLVACQLQGISVLYPTAHSPNVRDPGSHSPLGFSLESPMPSNLSEHLGSLGGLGGGALGGLGSADISIETTARKSGTSPIFSFSSPTARRTSVLQPRKSTDSGSSTHEPTSPRQALDVQNMSMGPQAIPSTSDPASFSSPESVIRKRKSEMVHGPQFTSSAKEVLTKIREASESVNGPGTKLSVEARRESVIVRVAPPGAMKSPLMSPSLSPLVSATPTAPTVAKIKPTSSVEYSSESMDFDPNKAWEAEEGLILPSAARRSTSDTDDLRGNRTRSSQASETLSRPESGDQNPTGRAFSPVHICQLPTILGSIDHLDGQPLHGDIEGDT